MNSKSLSQSAIMTVVVFGWTRFRVGHPHFNSCQIQYTPMVPKTQNGQTVLVKIGRPLTAANQDELRKKMQNRVSAIEARMRKKRKMEELERKVADLTKENETLRIENARLQCKGMSRQFHLFIITIQPYALECSKQPKVTTFLTRPSQ